MGCTGKSDDELYGKVFAGIPVANNVRSPMGHEVGLQASAGGGGGGSVPNLYCIVL